MLPWAYAEKFLLIPLGNYYTLRTKCFKSVMPPCTSDTPDSAALSTLYIPPPGKFFLQLCVHALLSNFRQIRLFLGFSGGWVVKNPPANAGDEGLIPGLRRSPGEENDKPLQYSCLGNPMDRGVWWAMSMGSQRVRHDLVTKQQWQILLLVISVINFCYSTCQPLKLQHLFVWLLSAIPLEFLSSHKKNVVLFTILRL